jgi:transcriptional regulator with XRE-family HTH domain
LSRRIITPRPWLTELRKEKGFATITSLAVALDVCDNTVLYWETGDRSPSPARVVEIAKVLDTPVSDMFVRFFGKSA